MAPLAHSLAAAGLKPSLIFTGQHPRLSPAEFGLDRFAADHLGCPGQRDPMDHVRAVREALCRVLASGPDLLFVQGDTSSAFGAALAGFEKGVPVAHVEAGLRTHDRSLPWPEEDFRVAIDREADLLFAPTSVSAANLRAEEVRGQISVTGNTGIDAVLAAEARLPPLGRTARNRPIVLVTCHRRESWQNGLTSVAKALLELASSRRCTIRLILHPNPTVRERMEGMLSGIDGVELAEPCGHLDLLQHMRDADLVLSDSGGMQEEAPTLGVPLLVLRDKTERPEGIASGNCRLVGTDRQRIVGEVCDLLDHPARLEAMSRRSLPYGDGQAAPRIAALVGQWLARRMELSLAL